MKHVTKIFSLLVVVGFGLAGCASNSELAAVQAKTDAAMQTANEAKAEARSASEIAQDAKATADSAENKMEMMSKNPTGKHK